MRALTRTGRNQSEQEIFDQRHGLEEKGKDLLSSFPDDVYLPWSKANKKSWRDDAYMLPMLKEYFEGKTLREISAQYCLAEAGCDAFHDRSTPGPLRCSRDYALREIG